MTQHRNLAEIPVLPHRWIYISVLCLLIAWISNVAWIYYLPLIYLVELILNIYFAIEESKLSKNEKGKTRKNKTEAVIASADSFEATKDRATFDNPKLTRLVRKIDSQQSQIDNLKQKVANSKKREQDLSERLEAAKRNQNDIRNSQDHEQASRLAEQLASLRKEHSKNLHVVRMLTEQRDGFEQEVAEARRYIAQAKSQYEDKVSLIANLKSEIESLRTELCSLEKLREINKDLQGIKETQSKRIADKDQFIKDLFARIDKLQLAKTERNELSAQVSELKAQLALLEEQNLKISSELENESSRSHRLQAQVSSLSVQRGRKGIRNLDKVKPKKEAPAQIDEKSLSILQELVARNLQFCEVVSAEGLTLRHRLLGFNGLWDSLESLVGSFDEDSNQSEDAFKSFLKEFHFNLMDSCKIAFRSLVAEYNYNDIGIPCRRMIVGLEKRIVN